MSHLFLTNIITANFYTVSCCTFRQTHHSITIVTSNAISASSISDERSCSDIFTCSADQLYGRPQHQSQRSSTPWRPSLPTPAPYNHVQTDDTWNTFNREHKDQHMINWTQWHWVVKKESLTPIFIIFPTKKRQELLNLRWSKLRLVMVNDLYLIRSSDSLCQEANFNCHLASFLWANFCFHWIYKQCYGDINSEIHN